MRNLGMAALAAVCAGLCGHAAAQSSSVVKTPPEWLKKPTGGDLVKLYPPEALQKTKSGQAVIHCMVNVQGTLHGCVVINEAPAGMGFGAAAVKMTRTMSMKPATENGKPVESDFTFPIKFSVSGDPPVPVLPEMIWNRTPSAIEIQTEIAKKAGDKYADGKIVLQCDLDRENGKLSGCGLLDAGPGMTPFADVARALSDRFQGNPAALAQFKTKVKVNLAFSFPDMQSEAWRQRYLTRPRWLKTISPNPDKATFPEAAAKAGLKTGSAVVDCVLDATGALAHCITTSESTPGVGFGPMAQAIAEAFVANPWTDDGLPADGAHVRMPIQMDYAPPSDAPAAAAKP